MTAIGDTEAINLSTGEHSQRVSGDGNSFLRSLGIPGLRQVNPADLAEYEHAMDEAIPEIVQAVRNRERLAHEARQRFLGSTRLCGARYHDSGQPCTHPQGHWQRHSWAGTEPSDAFGG